MTSQGHPLSEFRRAIQHGNLVAAEIAARQCRLDHREALELTARVAQKDRPCSQRLAARWLQRWLEQAKTPTVDDAAMAAGALLALGAARRKPPR